MCVVAIALLQSSCFPLVIVHNRDEFRDRAFTPLTKSQGFQNDSVYGGIDGKSDGMWFGVTEKGKIGLITSFRDRSRWDPKAPSRGVLVKDFLYGSQSAAEFFDKKSHEELKHNPFNLVLGTVEGLFYWNSDSKNTVPLETGIHVLSNACLNTEWPKTRRLKEEFSEIINSQKEGNFDSLEERLLPLMKDESKAEVAKLPKTGLPLEQEMALSSIFVNTPQYGSLTTTIYMVNAQGIARITEFQYQANGSQNRRSYEIHP